MHPESTTPPFREWSILELFGHRRLAGLVTEQQIADAGFLRLDVPGEGDAAAATQFYPPSAVYCLTPVTEELARQVAAGNRPAPVTRWELPASRETPGRRGDEGYGEDDRESY